MENGSKNKMYITVFDKWERRFDLSQFALQRTNEIFFKDVSHMCNINQLEEKIDSVFSNVRKREDNMGENLQSYLLFSNAAVDTFVLHASPLPPITVNASSGSGLQLLKGLGETEKQDILEAALGKARNVKSYTSAAQRDIDYLSKDRYEFRVEYYRKFKLSVICLLFLFIGAPLGAIIRRGGLGWPFFFSILIFIVFYAFNIIGEKMAEEGSINIFVGAWLSVIIMIPIASFLTLKSNSDSVIFNSETYTKIIRRIFQPKAKV
jgi:lipopolysaccharide export system permease protein